MTSNYQEENFVLTYSPTNSQHGFKALVTRKGYQWYKSTSFWTLQSQLGYIAALIAQILWNMSPTSQVRWYFSSGAWVKQVRISVKKYYLYTNSYMYTVSAYMYMRWYYTVILNIVSTYIHPHSSNSIWDSRWHISLKKEAEI